MKTYQDTISDYQQLLKDLLLKYEIQTSKINDVLDSGYFAWQSINSYNTPEKYCVYDGLYGNKSPSSLIPLNTFCEYLKDKKSIQKIPQTSIKHIKSFKEAKEVLQSAQHSRLQHKMCFRGQSQEYFIKRKCPNPFARNSNDEERLIIPGIYRKNFSPGHNPNLRPYNFGSSLLKYSYDLIYKGIDWKNLYKKNVARYGNHSTDELQDFPDEENQTFHKRWLTHENSTSLDHILLEQHYGIETHGLDVTFDLGTAIFFATNKFVKRENGTCTYTPLDSLENSIVYCIVYESPPLKETEHLITKTELFSHIPPTRPSTQKCALPMFSSDKVNETARDLELIFKFDSSFDRTGIPTKEDLFPGPEKDPFYKELLNLKHKNINQYQDIVEYKW